MRLLDVIRLLRGAAQGRPEVRTVVDNDIYRLNAMPDVRYGVFAYTQGQHALLEGGDLMRYVFTLFYVDRLTEDKDNEVEIQSTGVEVLKDIILRVYDAAGYGAADRVEFTTFNQRFSDECAGVFARVEFTVAADAVCPE